MSEYEHAAQLAGEERLDLLFESGDCTCETCLVREVLTAAWPHLKKLAAEEMFDAASES